MSKHLHEKSAWKENTSDGTECYLIKIQHKGLGAHRILKDFNPGLLHKKAENQFKLWDLQWHEILNKNDNTGSSTKNPALAEEETANARKVIQEIEGMAIETAPLSDNDLIWNELTNQAEFPETDPAELLARELMHFSEMPEPTLHVLPVKPDETDFIKKLTFAERKVSFLANAKLARQQKKYLEAVARWEAQTAKLNSENEHLLKIYRDEKTRFEAGRQQLILKYGKAGALWKKRKAEFYKNQHELNACVSNLRQSYAYHEPAAVINYGELILNKSHYPAGFPKDFDLEYNPDTKMLVAEYILPSPFHFPVLKEVKYDPSKKDYEKFFLSKEQLAGLFETALFKITLRTLYELFSSDEANAIDKIVFNGWVESIDKFTRKTVLDCILSVKTEKTEFRKINPAKYDPKTCFEMLDGLSAERLIDLTPIDPIAQLNRYDKRFGPSHGGLLSENHNLVSV